MTQYRVGIVPLSPAVDEDVKTVELDTAFAVVELMDQLVGTGRRVDFILAPEGHPISAYELRVIAAEEVKD